MNKFIKTAGAVVISLAIFAMLFYGIPTLSAYGDVRNFQDTRNIVESSYSDEELVRAREMYGVFQANVLPDSVTPVDHYVDTWIDGGYKGIYRVLLKDKNDELTVKEFELDSLLASNFEAYLYGISTKFPSKLVFNYINNVVISPSTPEYEYFTEYTTSFVFEELNSPRD